MDTSEIKVPSPVVFDPGETKFRPDELKIHPNEIKRLPGTMKPEHKSVRIGIHRMLLPPYRSASEYSLDQRVGIMFADYLQHNLSNEDAIIYVALKTDRAVVVGFDLPLRTPIRACIGLQPDWTRLRASSFVDPGPPYLSIGVAVRLFINNLRWPLWARGARDPFNGRALGEALTKAEVRAAQRLPGACFTDADAPTLDNSLRHLLVLQYPDGHHAVVNRAAYACAYLGQAQQTEPLSGLPCPHLGAALQLLSSVWSAFEHGCQLPVIDLKVGRISLRYGLALGDVPKSQATFVWMTN